MGRMACLESQWAIIMGYFQPINVASHFIYIYIEWFAIMKSFQGLFRMLPLFR